jgi:hypothetical protein
MEPTRLFPVIVLLSLVTVEYGGWTLLGFLTGHGKLSDYRQRMFRDGHAHAGVLLVLALAYFSYLGHAGFSTGTQWIAGSLLAAGIILQSGGFFIHMAVGQAGKGSAGTLVTRTGGILLAAALIMLAIGLINHL